MSRLGRLWGIRHVRYLWLRRRLLLWVDAYRRAGGPGLFINESDLRYLDAVWRGDR